MLLREPVAADWAEALAQGKRLAAADRHHRPREGRPPGRRHSTTAPATTPAAARTRSSTPGDCWARRRWWCRAERVRHPQQPRHRMLAVLGDGHRPGPGGGLGSRAAGGQALARGRAAGARRTSTSAPATARCTTSTTCSTSPRATARSGPAGPGPGRRRVRRGPRGRRRGGPRGHLRPGLHPGPGGRHAAREGVRLLPRPGRHLPQRLFPGAGPRGRPRAVRGRTALLGPFRAAVPRGRIRAAPELAQHPHRAARSWARSRSPTWTTCWPPRPPAVTGCWWRPPCRASGSTPRSGATLHTASSSPPAPPRRTPTRTGCGPTPTRTSPRRPGRPSPSPMTAARRASAGERDAMALAFRQSCPL